MEITLPITAEASITVTPSDETIMSLPEVERAVSGARRDGWESASAEYEPKMARLQLGVDALLGYVRRLEAKLALPAAELEALQGFRSHGMDFQERRWVEGDWISVGLNSKGEAEFSERLRVLRELLARAA